MDTAPAALEAALANLSSAVISKCAKQAQSAETEAWMCRIWEAGVKPDAASFNSTIDAWGRTSDVGRAEQWLAMVATLGVVPCTIPCYAEINACARTGEVERAEYTCFAVNNSGDWFVVDMRDVA